MLVSRWPVVDAQLRVVGYRIAYAVVGQGRFGVLDTDAARQLFDDALSVVDVDGPAERVAHLPVSPEFLVALGVPPVRPDRVLLQLPYAQAREPALAEILERLIGRGYSLELTGLPGPQFDLNLLDGFRTVDIDLAAWSAAAIAAAVPRILDRRARPVASHVRDYEQYEWARDQGFELFDGPFYATPRLRGPRSLGIDLATLASLLALDRSDANVDEVVRIIEQDVGLSVKLLRYLNSAYLARRGTIRSIRQAVMMLGTSGVARWALLISLTTGPGTPRELAQIALTRARLCKSLGDWEAGTDPDELFTVGLLSLADALLGVPLETVLADLPLADRTRAALLHHEGPAGGILKAVLAYECGAFDLPRLAEHSARLLDRYRDAVHWADDTMAAII